MRIKRRTKRFLKRVLIAIPILMVGAFLYLVVRSPSQAAPSTIVVKTTPERLERGRYLFNNLLECDGCHSSVIFRGLEGLWWSPDGARAAL